MISTLLSNLKLNAGRLIVTDLLFKVLALILLTPAVSLLFRLFLSLSGRTVLADGDIAQFLLQPVGWLTTVIVGGTLIGISAFELAMLMAITVSGSQGKPLTVAESFRFAMGKAAGIFQLAARLVFWLLLLAAPFLAVGGGLYLWLLTDHDINFYLTQKPPRFWWAVGLIGTVLAVLAILVIRTLIHWSCALQIYLFEDVPPNRCLQQSHERMVGNRTRIGAGLVGWMVVNIGLASLGAMIVLGVGSWLVPSATGSIGSLVLAIGMAILFWSVINLGLNLLAVITLAVLLGECYVRWARGEAFQCPVSGDRVQGSRLQWTCGRLIAAMLLGLVVAVGVGTLAVRTVQLEDNVEITAHRGGAANAPENTLAAIRQGITDQTDWIEIDVQESSDGVVVVVHDKDLKKVGGTDFKIWEKTAEELRAVDIGSHFSSEFQDQRVPTLAEVLELCRDQVKLNIELKYYGHDQDLEQKVIDLVESHGMADDVVVMSLDLAGIQKLKSLRPDWTAGLLVAVAAGDLSRLDVDFLAVNTKLATRRLIRAAHAQGTRVHVWTVNDAVTMSTMISRGVDNLITDRPALARQVLDQRQELSPVERMLTELAFLFGVVPEPDGEQ